MARVLVADSDKTVRDLVRPLLNAWGHDVVSLADGRSALQACLEDPFDLTLLDLDLPRVTGLEVLRGIRAAERAESPTVVLMGARGRDGEAALAYELGADEFVFKPFTLGFLTSFANAILAHGAPDEPMSVPA